MNTLDDTDDLLAPDVEALEPVEADEAECEDCGEIAVLTHGVCSDCYDPDFGDDSDWREAQQEQYDIDFPPMADWMQTELEYRSRPEGY